MKTDGLLIARNKKADAFFTSSSAYNCPQWKHIGEATVYPTHDAAHRALLKLLKYGSYEARIVPVSEAIELEMPDEPVSNDPSSSTSPSKDMVAGNHEDDLCQTCKHEPCTCDSEECENCRETPCACQDDQDAIECENCGSEHCECDDEEERTNMPVRAKGQRVEYQGDVYNVVDDSGTGTAIIAPIDGIGKHIQVKSAELFDISNEETITRLSETSNKPITVVDLPPVEKTKYHDAAFDVNVDVSEPNVGDHEEKIRVPAEVMSDIAHAIKEFERCAEISDGRDDARSSFCMTCAEAFKALQDELKTGTVESIKRAQIMMTSWMNPITSNLPTSVQKFIYMGGRKPTLRDIFDDKRGR